MSEATQVQGVRQGSVVNAGMRQRWSEQGGGRALAIELISMLEVRGGRTTGDLIRCLEIEKKQLAPIVKLARRFERDYENSEIRAVRDDDNGCLYHYWIITNGSDLLRMQYDDASRIFAILNRMAQRHDVVSAHALSDSEAERLRELSEYIRGSKAVLGEVYSRGESTFRGLRQASRIQALGPAPEELGVAEREQLHSGSIWEAVRKSA